LDHVPERGVAEAADDDDFRGRPDWSDHHGWQSDDGVIAQGGHGFQRHVSSALDRPFVVLLEEDGADEPDDDVVVGADADDLGPALGRVKKECVTVAPSTVEAWARLSEEVRRYMRSKAG
jgi:hypothetical protein